MDVEQDGMRFRVSSCLVIFLFNIRDYIKGFANGCEKRYQDVLGQEKPDL